MQNNLDFTGLAAALLDRAEGLLQEWLPGGKNIAGEYCCGDLRGGAGESLKVNLKNGRWADFAGTDKGGDLISLYAAVKGMKQGQAARELAKAIGYHLGGDERQEKRKRAPAKEVIKPPPDAQPPADWNHPAHGKPTQVWEYKDGTGAPLFFIARYDTEGGKEFLPWSWSTEGRWVMKGWPEPRPLYGLDLLSSRPNAAVLIVEGEKAADAARQLLGKFYAVITWPNGAKGTKKADWSILKGRKVMLWPDCDRHIAKDEKKAQEAGVKIGEEIPYNKQPGQQAMAEIGEILLPLCEEVKVLDVSGQPDGWDAADALKDGWTVESFLAWAKPRVSIYRVAEIQPEGPMVSPDPKDAPTSMFTIWDKFGLALTTDGVPITNMDNALRVLDADPKLADLVWFDEFHQRYFTRWDSVEPREWRDKDTLNLTTYMQRHIGLRRMSDDTVHKAMVIKANRQTKNEPRDWMETLKWDGAPRIAAFFTACLGAEDNEYTAAASKNFWVGMVARIYSPGCKLDNMVVLEGAQGKFKSSCLRVIGGKWYAEAHESVMNKDFFLNLHGKMLIEIAELDSFNRAEVLTIKRVISCENDRYRAPYGRVAEDHPRMSIFVGTTNESAYLRDNTGGRRFWPITIGSIWLEMIADNRDQLFAEAVAEFKKGTPWYIMPAAVTQKEQEARRQADEWETVVDIWLREHGKDDTSVREVATECLRIDIGKLDKGTQMRIAAVLRNLGFDKSQKRVGDSGGKVWLREKDKTIQPELLDPEQA